MRLSPLFALAACASQAADSAPVSAAPQIFLVSPEDGESGQAGEAVTVAVIVSDDLDDVNTLDVQLESDLMGPLDHALPDKLGRVELHATLPEGDHLLTVTVTDTDDQSASTGTDYVVRGTSIYPPDADVLPDTPVTGDELTAAILRDAWSNDGTPFDYAYTWSVNGVVTEYTEPTIPEGVVQAGETWSVRVSAYSDELHSVEDLASVEIGDAPPVVGGGKVELLAETGRLGCRIDEPSDPEGAPLRVHYAWTLGDAELADDVAERAVPAAPRGTLVGCTAWVDDGTNLVPIATQPWAVPNHAPVVAEVTVDPARVTTGATLGCDLPEAATDLDGDPVTVNIAWVVNGQEGAAAGPTFSGALVRGDNVGCVATADDGVGGSVTVPSTLLTVGNAPPYPPTVAVSPATPTVGDVLTCTITAPAVDPDGDPVRCDTEWRGIAPVGAGDVFVTSGLQPGENVTCAVTCTDGELLSPPALASVTLRAPISGDGEAADAMVLLAGTTPAGRFGASVAALPDLDGDGLGELAIGAPGTGTGGTIYVYPASTLRGASALGPTAAAASWLGEAPGDDLGGFASLADVGDLDGDGLGDVAVAAPWSDTGGADAGQVYVLYGGLPLALDGALPDVATWSATGEAGDWLGAELGGGDLDGDGLSDLVVGAPTSSVGGAHSGAVALFFGDTDRPTGPRDLSDSDALVVGGATGDQLGWTADACGDVDGDGYGELALGAPRASPDGQYSAGAVWLIGGRALGGYTTVDGAAWLRLTGDAAGDRLGSALACPGDLDADGLADLAVGAPHADRGTGDNGLVAVLFGQTGGDVALGAHEADALFWGGEGNAALGSVLADAGDLDHDRVHDLLLGAPGAASGAGLVALLRASSAGDWAPDGGAVDASIAGNAVTDRIGEALAGGLDLEGDGFGEVALGAAHADVGADEGGAVYVFTGRSSF